MARLLITIDGPAGVGKSTTAEALAARLGLPRLDTGTMFRYLAFRLGPEAASLSDADLARRMAGVEFALEGNQMICDGHIPDKRLRAPEIAMRASAIATRGVVREFLLRAQRKLAERDGLVAEGRDMGTVVFPMATHKFFLDARPGIRARRRWLQNGGDLSELTEEIMRRDEQDRNRQIAPLRPAHDAMIVDTSELDQQEVLRLLLERIHGQRPEPLK